MDFGNVFHATSGVVLNVNFQNFLIGFKFVIGNALYFKDFATYSRSFSQLQMLLNVELYTRYDVNQHRRIVVQNDQNLFHQLSNECIDLQQTFENIWSVEYIEALHNKIQTSLLERLVYVDYGTDTIVQIVWPKTMVANNFGDRSIHRGWNGIDSLYIWIWIHILALHTSIHHSQDYQIKFLKSITPLIKCTVCQGHFQQRLPALIQMVQNSYSVYIVLLKLHQFIRLNSSPTHFHNEQLDIPTPYMYDVKYRGLYMYIHSMFRSAFPEVPEGQINIL